MLNLSKKANKIQCDCRWDKRCEHDIGSAPLYVSTFQKYYRSCRPTKAMVCETLTYCFTNNLTENLIHTDVVVEVLFFTTAIFESTTPYTFHNLTKKLPCKY